MPNLAARLDGSTDPPEPDALAEPISEAEEEDLSRFEQRPDFEDDASF